MMETPNLNYIEQLAAGDEKFKASLIEILKKEIPDEKAKLFDHLKNGDLPAAVQSVHKLKHKISFLGMEKSYNIAVEFEKNLRNDSMRLQDDFIPIIETIDDFVKSL